MTEPWGPPPGWTPQPQPRGDCEACSGRGVVNDSSKHADMPDKRCSECRGTGWGDA